MDTEDADGSKTEGADESRLTHPVCIARVGRTTDAWVTAVTPAPTQATDGLLLAVGAAPKQRVVECRELLWLMTERQPSLDASATLTTIRHRNQAAARACQAQTETTSLVYLPRLLSLDRWSLRDRLTRCPTGTGTRRQTP